MKDRPKPKVPADNVAIEQIERDGCANPARARFGDQSLDREKLTSRIDQAAS